MAAVRAMAFMCDAVLWPLLRAVKPTADKHVFDVLPHVWPAAINFFKAAAAAPEKVIDGSLSIDLGANAAPHPASTTEGQLKRSARARKDMERIRAAATGDELVAKLLTAAFEAMIPGTENHAAEYVGNGKCALANITPELRATFDAMLSTSTSVERLHALGKASDARAGQQRGDTRAGIVLAKYNKQGAWLEGLSTEKLAQAMSFAWRRGRLELRQTLKQQRIASGRVKREERDTKLAGKRAKRDAKTKELERLKTVALASKYSELERLQNADLADQLKVYKLIRGRSGFTVAHSSRESYVLAVQAQMALEFGDDVNDLPDGDAGFTNRAVRRRKVAHAD
eukprot:scaffold5290_cov116-Isochrysis_galbana.AAC.1